MRFLWKLVKYYQQWSYRRYCLNTPLVEDKMNRITLHSLPGVIWGLPRWMHSWARWANKIYWP